MKWLKQLAIICCLVPSLGLAGVLNNQLAPDFTAQDANGKMVALSDFKDKIVVLEWSNFDCPFVKKFYRAGKMQEFQKQATSNDVIWLTIMSSAKGKQGYYEGNELNQRLQKEGSNATHVLRDESGVIGKTYGAKTTPHMFVIAPDGKVVYQGAIDSIRSISAADIGKADNYVMQAIAALKAGEPLAKSNTVPYGCSVKY